MKKRAKFKTNKFRQAIQSLSYCLNSSRPKIEVQVWPNRFSKAEKNIRTKLKAPLFALSGPKGIAVNRSGHLVVVDNRASCVLVFQPNGKLVQKFGSRGSDPGKFAGPHFVAIDSQEHIIISDFHNHSIKVLVNYFLRMYPRGQLFLWQMQTIEYASMIRQGWKERNHIANLDIGICDQTFNH